MSSFKTQKTRDWLPRGFFGCLGWLLLFITVQPFAYVVASYTCHDRKYVNAYHWHFDTVGTNCLYVLVCHWICCSLHVGPTQKGICCLWADGHGSETVRNLFLVENGIIGGVAFLLGALIGTGLSGLLNQVIQNIFEVPHTYRVLFSFRAWGMTLFFFILMYGFGMFRAAKVIRRQKVIDLLYDNQKNEEIGFHSLLRSVLTGLLSIAVMVAGVILLEKGLHIQTNEALLYCGGVSANSCGCLWATPKDPGFAVPACQTKSPAKISRGKSVFLGADWQAYSIFRAYNGCCGNLVDDFSYNDVYRTDNGRRL